MASGTHTPSLTAFKRHPDLQAAKSAEEDPSGEGIDTPSHSHHFAGKGIDPAILNSSLKQHIAAGAHKGERRLNDFSADPQERLNPHLADSVKEISAPIDEAAGTSETAPAEESKA